MLKSFTLLFTTSVAPNTTALTLCNTSPVAQVVKCLSTMRETRVRSLGGEDLLEKAVATHSNILAWKMPWTEEPGRLQSMGSPDTTERLHNLEIACPVPSSLLHSKHSHTPGTFLSPTLFILSLVHRLAH